MSAATPDTSPAGGCLVTPDGSTLPLEATSLQVVARGGVARVVLEQRFRNPHAVPLAVRYQVPLPADGAVSGFAFTMGDKRIVGEVDRKERARERFEQAIIEGRSAALLDQERSSLFTQEIGNIPAGETVTAELTVDQKLRWLDEGRWEWRFPTVVAPRYLGAPGRVADGSRVAVDVADRELAPRASLTLRIDESVALGGRPESTSHGLCVSRDDDAMEVGFRAEDGAHLDRDVVVTWPVAGDDVQTQLTLGSNDAANEADTVYGLLTLLPPEAGTAASEVARDLCILIDASGSMHGAPIEQARQVSSALVDSLTERDSFTLISFANRPRKWRGKPARATAKAKAAARKWLVELQAGGGTEMHSGILTALEPLRADGQRQVVLISDGLIGFEDEIVGTILEHLPAASRVHTVGVGSAVNRSLTGPAARAGRGYEAIIGIDEDPEPVARRLVARTASPLVVDLELGGSALRAHHPERVPDLFAGAPALVSLSLAADGGELWVRGKTAAGRWEHRVVVAAGAAEESQRAAKALFGREAVEDLEMRRAAGECDVDEQVEALGLRFHIATRLTSWVAVSRDRTVDPTEPSRREILPHELPHGMSVERLGLRGAGGPLSMTQSGVLGAVAGPVGFGARTALPPPPAAPPPPGAAAPPAGPAAPSPARGGAAPKKRKGRVAPRDEELDGLADFEEADFDDAPGSYAEEAMERAEEEAPPPQAERTRRAAPAQGVGRRLLDGVRRMFGAVEELEIDGRVIILQDDRICVELELPLSLPWDPREVIVELDDGTEIAMDIVLDHSTRPGAVTAGQIVRLTLRLAGRALDASPTAVHLVSGRCRILIHL